MPDFNCCYETGSWCLSSAVCKGKHTHTVCPTTDVSSTATTTSKCFERVSAIDSAVANSFVRQQPNYGGGDGDDLIAVYGSGWPNSEAKIPTTGAKEEEEGKGKKKEQESENTSLATHHHHHKLCVLEWPRHNGQQQSSASQIGERSPTLNTERQLRRLIYLSKATTTTTTTKSQSVRVAKSESVCLSNRSASN